MIEEITEFEAWYGGFIYGAESCIKDGKIVSLEDFQKSVESNELDTLLLVMNVGRDEEHGIWSIVGIRMAIYMLLLTQWDPTLINDHTSIDDLWSSISDKEPEVIAATVAEELVNQIGLPIVMIDEEASRFIRHFLPNEQTPETSGIFPK